MIGKRQLAVLDRARSAVTISPAEFATIVRDEGGAGEPSGWTAAVYVGVLDRLTILGFRDRRRSVLSADTLAAVRALFDGLAMTALEADTLLRLAGEVGDFRDLDGDGLLRLLIVLEKRGAPVAGFIAARRSVTPKQLALLRMVRAEVGHSENDLSWALQHLAGVNAATDLDQRGFDLLMAVMRNFGYRPRASKPERETFGARPGFASAAQLGLIRELWAEWSGGSDEAALATWLEHSYRVSALRFLTAATASGAITALKAMKGRKAEPARAKA